MSATVQLNARMSKSLKASGDEALALIGLSPTQAVRALWEKASRRGKDLEEIAALLCGSESIPGDAGELQDAELAASWALVEDMLAGYGLAYDRPADMPSDKELLEQALHEHSAEGGLS